MMLVQCIPYLNLIQRMEKIIISVLKNEHFEDICSIAFMMLVQCTAYLNSLSVPLSLLFPSLPPSPSLSFPPQHVFIPVLPSGLIDFVCSPLPYIIGINPSCIKQIETMETMEEALIVDLEKKKFVRKVKLKLSYLHIHVRT